MNFEVKKTQSSALSPQSRIYVAGHRGLVGSAIVRNLEKAGCVNIITRTHAELELMDQAAVQDFFRQEQPEFVFLAAAKVGGIMANSTYPAEFIHQNLVVQANVIHQAWQAGVKRLLFLGSSCIYPKECPQPIKEEYLLTGPLEPTNQPYAVAKIAGIETCRAYNRQYGTQFLAAMPTNLFGPADNYDLEKSHVIPALIRKFHEAKVDGRKEVVVWGSGTPRREFLFSEEAAAACVFLLNLPDKVFSSLLSPHSLPLINIGSGRDMTIRELAEAIQAVVGFSGSIVWDKSKPDGTMQKLLDISLLESLGWQRKMTFTQGLEAAYTDFRDSKERRD